MKEINLFTLISRGDNKEFYSLYQIKDEFLENEDNQTLLQYSYSCNRIEIAKFLIEKNFAFNSQDNKGYTILHYLFNSMTYKWIELIELILNKKPDINLVDNNGNTLIFDAVKNRRIPLSFIEKLLIMGSDCQIQNNNGVSALDLVKKLDNQKLLKLCQFKEFN